MVGRPSVYSEPVAIAILDAIALRGFLRRRRSREVRIPALRSAFRRLSWYISI
jgi:hypothetical protein